jgi:tetratricopeptide (TPR) repeat protein
VLPLFAALLATLAITSQQPSKDPKAAYTRALQLETEGNHPAALALLWETAGALPRDPDVQNRLGEALERIGALDAAIEAYDRAVAVRPGFAKAFNNLVLVLVKAGRGPQALERARAQVAAAPSDADSLFTLGLAQTDQDVDAAIATFRRVLTMAPGHGLAHYNLALVLKRVDRAREAIDELSRSLAIEPRPEAHLALAGIHFQQGDFEPAERALTAAIAAEPRYVDAYVMLGAVRKAQRRYRAAAEALTTAIALRPDLWSAHATLAQVSTLDGDEAAAGRHAAEAERLRRRAQVEQEAGVWTAVGTASLDAGNPAAAVERFRRALAIFELYAPAHYQLGRALQRLGQLDASRAAFARARQLNPSLVSPAEIR